jgi:hypothetical protein
VTHFKIQATLQNNNNNNINNNYNICQYNFTSLNSLESQGEATIPQELTSTSQQFANTTENGDNFVLGIIPNSFTQDEASCTV